MTDWPIASLCVFSCIANGRPRETSVSLLDRLSKKVAIEPGKLYHYAKRFSHRRRNKKWSVTGGRRPPYSPLLHPCGRLYIHASTPQPDFTFREDRLCGGTGLSIRCSRWPSA